MNPKRRLLLLSMLLAFTSIFQMGYTNAYPNTAIVEFRDYLNDSSVPLRSLTTSEYEWRWSAMLNSYFIGFAIGSCATGYIADRIGRRLTLLLGNVANLASVVVAFLSIWFYTPVLFGISRLIMSLGAAVSMNSLILLLQESAMSDMKGVVSFNAEMAFVVTNMLGALFGMQSVLGKNLLLLIGVSLVPTTLSVVMTFWVKESPRYLLLKKKDSDAASKSIYFYQRSNEEEIQKALEDVQREAQLENKDSSFFELFTTPHLRKGFLLGLTTMQLTTSIWPVVYYSTDFLTRAGSSPQLAELVSTVMLFVSSLSTMAGMVVVERCSRKWLLIACASVNIAALVGFTGCAAFQYKFDYLTYGCIASLIVHGMSYSIGLGPIAWFITSELVPLANRASAQSLVLAINHVFALIITFLTLPLYSSMGPTILLLMFIIPGFFCLMILVIYLPETRNVHINDVVLELQGLRKRNKAQTYAS